MNWFFDVENRLAHCVPLTNHFYLCTASCSTTAETAETSSATSAQQKVQPRRRPESPSECAITVTVNWPNEWSRKTTSRRHIHWDTGACRRHAAQQDIACSCLCVVQFVLRPTFMQMCFAELLNIVYFHNWTRERSAFRIKCHLQSLLCETAFSGLPPIL